MRLLKAGILIVLAGCQQQFVDQRPPKPLDTAASDLGAVAGDLAAASPGDLARRRGVLAKGLFEGRGGHGGAGGASLFRRDDGTVELRLDGDFAVTGVVGPEVVLSAREALPTIDPGAGDLDLGPLAHNSGAQSYPVAAGDGGRRQAWIYCKPFGVEVARAVLMETP